MATHTLPPEGWVLTDLDPNVSFEPTPKPQPWNGCLFPVFVTADIPTETLNQCLERSSNYLAMWNMEEYLGLSLISDPDGPAPKNPSYAPVGNFTPPAAYKGKSAADLRSHFQKQFARDEDAGRDVRASASSFVILDEQTRKDDTALLVVVDGEDLQLARSFFECICQALSGPDMGDGTVDDVPGGQKYIEDGMLVYRPEWYNHVCALLPMPDEMEDEEKPTEWGTQFDDNGFPDWHPNFRKSETEIWEEHRKSMDAKEPLQKRQKTSGDSEVEDVKEREGTTDEDGGNGRADGKSEK